MIFRTRLSLYIFSVLVLTVLHAGCAPRLPSSLPVTEGQRQNVLADYQSFRTAECGSPVDADISINLHSFGNSFKAEGVILIKPPDKFRATIIDKVGRPAVILVGTNDLLTLVNSARGKALIGTVSSLTRETDNPVKLEMEEIVSLLTGHLAPPVSALLDIRLDRKTADMYWLTFTAQGGKRHTILFDSGVQKVLRHIINTQDGDIILDIRYGKASEKRIVCSLPEELNITGGALGGGEITLRYERVFMPDMLRDSIFEIDLPEHYIIERKE